MKHLIFLIIALCVSAISRADNFIITHGELVKVYCPREDDTPIARADRLFGQDMQEVFGQLPVHTGNMADAKIIVATYDNADLRRYAKIRGISFERLAGRQGAFMLKVHNNGRQLFVVGSDAMGTAYGLMSLSREWGVSPFRWWADAPALPRDNYELGVAYEALFEASVPKRTLVLAGAQMHDNYLQDLLLRLRATGVDDSVTSASSASDSVFHWTLCPARQPYLGLNLALDAPELIRLEALRAYSYGFRKEWQLEWQHQLGGELQMLLFFDMAWNIDRYREPYAVDDLEDQHFMQMSGLSCNWSQIWNDFFDLTMLFHPEQPLSTEALRRGIGESQNLTMQLSLELNDKVVDNAYSNSYFRAVDYPINMAMTQMQRLCNMQLVHHNMAKPWAVEDCRQRMELLAQELPIIVEPKWRQVVGGLPVPYINLENSLMRLEDGVCTPMQVGSLAPLSSDEGTDLVYRSRRAVGTHVEPFEALRVPIVYQADSVRLRVALLPTRSYGRVMNCMISIDDGAPQLLRVDQHHLSDSQQFFDLVFAFDSSTDQHDIVLRTTSDAIYLQRIWLTDIK